MEQQKKWKSKTNGRAKRMNEKGTVKIKTVPKSKTSRRNNRNKFKPSQKRVVQKENIISTPENRNPGTTTGDAIRKPHFRSRDLFSPQPSGLQRVLCQVKLQLSQETSDGD